AGARPQLLSACGEGRGLGFQLLLPLRDFRLLLLQPLAFLAAALLGLGDLLLAGIEPGQRGLAALDLAETLVGLDGPGCDGFSLCRDLRFQLLQLRLAFTERRRILLEPFRSLGLSLVELAHALVESGRSLVELGPSLVERRLPLGQLLLTTRKRLLGLG